MESQQMVIHIGYTKCASTFLGKNLFPKLNVNFIRMRDQHDSREIKDYFKKTNDFDPSVVRTWVDRRKKKSLNTTILSDAGFSGNAQRNTKDTELFIMANNLKLTFPNAKILIIIRNQLSYITSSYAFRVTLKGLETRSFEKFLAQEGERGVFDRLEYHNLIGYYINLFGSNNILVLPLELLSQDSHRFIEELGEFAGLDINPKEILNIARSRPTSNSSIKNQNIINFMRIINRAFGFIISKQKYMGVNIGDKYYKTKEKIVPLIDSFWSDNKQDIRIPQEIEKQLIEKYKISNLHLQSMIDVDLNTYGYPIANSLELSTEEP
jgi:hypothetical protein